MLYRTHKIILDIYIHYNDIITIWKKSCFDPTIPNGLFNKEEEEKIITPTALENLNKPKRFFGNDLYGLIGYVDINGNLYKLDDHKKKCFDVDDGNINNKYNINIIDIDQFWNGDEAIFVTVNIFDAVEEFLDLEEGFNQQQDISSSSPNNKNINNGNDNNKNYHKNNNIIDETNNNKCISDKILTNANADNLTLKKLAQSLSHLRTPITELSIALIISHLSYIPQKSQNKRGDIKEQ
ncbi:12592_t:CDS:2 [Entrophospora sp. SA101]|nr:12592_t:CDS:2 [Entrophospora sp. SA101]